MFYSESALVSGSDDLEALAADVSPALQYVGGHLSGELAGGWMYDQILAPHKESVANCEALLRAVQTLYTNAGERIDQSIADYNRSQDENVTQVAEVWKALDAQGPATPIGRDTTGGVTRGALPSTGLSEPQHDVGHWIFDILSWPDYLSIGSWVRKIFGALWEALTGNDPWEQLWGYLGGDWEAIGLASSAWGELSDYMVDSADELAARMQIMFAGWYDSAAATACGGYFARAATAVDAAGDPLNSLQAQYNDVAWASFSMCQATYSLVDAALDMIASWLMGGASLLEAVAAFFSGGAMAIPAATTAVIAIIENLSAWWGLVMTALYMIIGISSQIRAANTEVTWVSIPEG